MLSDLRTQTLWGIPTQENRCIMLPSIAKGSGPKRGCPVALVVKTPPPSAGGVRDTGLIPGSRRSPGGRHRNPLQFPAYRIPWTEEAGGLPSIGLQRDRIEAT